MSPQITLVDQAIEETSLIDFVLYKIQFRIYSN